MPRPRLAPASAIAIALAIAHTAAAQTATAAARPDSTPFRRGQWGAQFSAGFDFQSLGALRFVSPRSAWIVDASGAVIADRSSVSDPAVGGQRTARQSRVFLNARAGRRRYRPVAGAVVAFSGLGVTAGGSRSRDSGFSRDSRGSSWSAGVYGELGGSYLVTRHLSVGAGVSGSVSYGRRLEVSEYEAPPETPPGGMLRSRQEAHQLELNARPLSLNLTLYF